MQSNRDKVIQIKLKEKRTGLNKVTVSPVGSKYQVKLNGKSVFPPANEKKAQNQLKKLKIDAIQHDKLKNKLEP